MTAALDVTGERYGRLIAVRCVGSAKSSRIWLFRCDCGGEVEALLSNVRRGNTSSCGCLHREVARATFLKHGHADHRPGGGAYRSWQAMKDRCLNPNHPRFAEWGGRGIKVCDRWLNDFPAFLEDMGERPPRRTLERIDNDGHYEPANCRWATHSEQRLNQRPARTSRGPKKRAHGTGRFTS